MNNKLGFFSSILVSLTVILFALSMLIGNDNLSYLFSMILSWGYVLLACSFLAKVNESKKAFACGGLAFACIYVVFINIVYYTQLTTVFYQTASSEVLKTLDFQVLGSLMFNFDLFGYGMMAISTLLIGISFDAKSKSDKWLKYLLMIHGVFAISSILLPMLNIFNANLSGGDYIGTLALLFWCSYFTPIGVLSAVHFFKRQTP